MKRTLQAMLIALVAIMMPIGAWAAAATDITVTIDTGTSVTLKDADGDGSYDIGTADELYAFAAAVNGGNTAINGELTANIVVNKNVLNADGDLNGDGSHFRVWTPIGNVNNEYTGTFDGAGFTVSGMYFNNSETNYVGLFGYVVGTVKNVGVLDSFLSGKFYVGGVVGVTNLGTVVTNCYNTGSISGISDVGGVVGRNIKATVTNCYNTGNISGNSNVGGVVGYNYGGTVTDCYNTGSVIGSGNYVGGVVGYVQFKQGKVTGCYNTGNVSGSSGYVGGVAGYNWYGTITGCYNTGNISGNSNVGGVVGYNLSQDSNADSIVTGCYNIGNISGNSNVGGVVGYNSSNATVTNCYYDSTVYSGSAIGTNNGTSTNVRGKTTEDFENGTVCELVGFHRPNESCVCIVCGAVAHSLDENCVCTVCGIVEHNFNSNGFCTVCETYQPATLNADGYYEITNAGQLFWFANHINTVDRTASAVLTADINLENRPWTPIGETNEASNNFRSHFDGQGHTIRGLKVEGGRAGLGFFGEVRTGTVENFTIYGEVVVSTDVSYVGGVIGSACGLNSDNDLERNGATIRNITSYVNLTAGAHGISMVGGFIGYANHETLIENCAWYGTFDAGKYRVDSGAGGFLGRVYDSSSVTIRNCAAYGTVKTAYQSGTHTESNGTPHEDIYIGGFLSFSPSGAQTLLQNNLWAGEIVNGTNLDIANAHLSAYGTLNDNTTVQNCYALEGTPYVTTGNAHTTSIATVTSAQLLSGEVAYLLQGEQAEQVWGQAIDTDDYPVLGGAAVYYGYLSCADDAVKVYTNTADASDAKPGHSPVDGICTVCGHIDAASDVTLRDGALPSFALAEDTEVASITYTRTLPNTEWNALYVPFEVEVTEALLADYDVAYANNMHAYDTDDNGEIDELEMEVIKIKQGTLHANHPYFIRARSEAARALTLAVEDAVLYATESVAMTCQSFYTTFTLTGIYSAMDADDFAALDGTHYAIATEGGWWRTEGLGAFRVYMTITEREGSPVKVSPEAMARVRIVARGEENDGETTGMAPSTLNPSPSTIIYDLAGRRVEQPTKGIYIVNGRKVIF